MRCDDDATSETRIDKGGGNAGDRVGVNQDPPNPR